MRTGMTEMKESEWFFFSGDERLKTAHTCRNVIFVML